MQESLIQWTLLNNPPELGRILNFNISTIVGEEISTDFGRIDFILSNNKNEHLIVELETVLNNRNKLDYCFNQINNYKNVKFVDETDYCILYAKETNEKSKRIIEQYGRQNSVITSTYSLDEAKKLYSRTIKRLSLNVGLALPNPKNYTICYLRWLNKIMKTFHDFGKSELSFKEIYRPFENSKKSRTNFNCYERIAMDFELFNIVNSKYILTYYGKEYIDNISPFVCRTQNVSSIDLTNKQKRLLISVLTNGNWENKIHKVNIYWFLRFIEVTDGSWLPKRHNFEQSKLDIARGLFKVSYKSRTMQEFLNWCSNYCIELGLVERLPSTSEYDQIILTPLGIEINNIFSMDLQIKKSRMNLNFKYND